MDIIDNSNICGFGCPLMCKIFYWFPREFAFGWNRRTNEIRKQMSELHLLGCCCVSYTSSSLNDSILSVLLQSSVFLIDNEKRWYVFTL